MLPTRRIDLGDDDYAMVIVPLIHKTSKLVQAYYKPYMKSIGKPVLLSELQAGKVALNNDYELDLNAVDDDAVADIFILNQVSEWSFGTVSRESIDNMPSDKYNLLVKELNGLYKPTPFPVKSN